MTQGTLDFVTGRRTMEMSTLKREEIVFSGGNMESDEDEVFQRAKSCGGQSSSSGNEEDIRENQETLGKYEFKG